MNNEGELIVTKRIHMMIGFKRGKPFATTMRELKDLASWPALFCRNLWRWTKVSVSNFFYTLAMLQTILISGVLDLAITLFALVGSVVGYGRDAFPDYEELDLDDELTEDGLESVLAAKETPEERLRRHEQIDRTNLISLDLHREYMDALYAAGARALALNDGEPLPMRVVLDVNEQLIEHYIKLTNGEESSLDINSVGMDTGNAAD